MIESRLKFKNYIGRNGNKNNNRNVNNVLKPYEYTQRIANKNRKQSITVEKDEA